MDTQRHPATLDDVRLAIFRQHTQLAELIDELEAHAMAVLAGGGEGKALSDALELLNARLVRHLEYVEVHLAKWLPAATATEVSQSLLANHGDQRSRLRGLLHDRDVFGDPRTFAREVLTFVHYLRKDIAGEDEKLRELL